MGNLAGSSARTKDAPLAERLNMGKMTGRLRLIAKDGDLDKILNQSASDLKNLRALDLSECGLKSLPSAIGTSLVKLQVLKLSDNPDLASLPVELAGLKELRKLDCSNCSKLQSLETIPKCVEELELSGCNFQGLVEHPLLPLSAHLTKLDLSNNPGITGFGPAFGFEILSNSLTELNMDNTAVQDVPESIGNLKSLSVLRLENTRVSSLPRSLLADTPVARLELKGTRMTKESFLSLSGADAFMQRRKARIDREIAGGITSPDTSVCGLD